MRDVCTFPAAAAPSLPPGPHHLNVVVPPLNALRVVAPPLNAAAAAAAALRLVDWSHRLCTLFCTLVRGELHYKIASFVEFSLDHIVTQKVLELDDVAEHLFQPGLVCDIPVGGKLRSELQTALFECKVIAAE